MPQGTQSLPSVQVIQATFDDIDIMAASPLAWNQQYEQIGGGRFQGRLSQVVLNSVHIGRVVWSPGVLQSGLTPKGTWVFGLPVQVKGSLHVRRRPVQQGELLSATSHDDIGFAATGETDIMVTALPVPLIDRWMQARRALSHPDDATRVTRVAAQFGFNHFGRLSASDPRRFGEWPSATLARVGGVKRAGALGCLCRDRND